MSSSYIGKNHSQKSKNYPYNRGSELKEEKLLRYIRENNSFDPDELSKDNTSVFPKSEWELAKMFRIGEVENAIVKTGVMMGYVVFASSEEEEQEFAPVTFEVIDYPGSEISSCWLLQVDEDATEQEEEVPETVNDLIERMAT